MRRDCPPRCPTYCTLVKKLLKPLGVDRRDDHAVAGIVSRPPQEIGLMATEHGRHQRGDRENQSRQPDRSPARKRRSLAARRAGVDSTRRKSRQRSPASRIGRHTTAEVPRSLVRVLHDRQFEGQTLHVGDKVIRRKTGTVTGARRTPLASNTITIAGLSHAPERRSSAKSITTAPAANSIG